MPAKPSDKRESEMPDGFFIPAEGYLTCRVVTKGIKDGCVDSLRREYRLRRFTIPRCRAWYLHRAEIRELLNFKFPDFFR